MKQNRNSASSACAMLCRAFILFVGTLLPREPGKVVWVNHDLTGGPQAIFARFGFLQHGRKRHTFSGARALQDKFSFYGLEDAPMKLLPAEKFARSGLIRDAHQQPLAYVAAAIITDAHGFRHN